MVSSYIIELIAYVLTYALAYFIVDLLKPHLKDGFFDYFDLDRVIAILLSIFYIIFAL